MTQPKAKPRAKLTNADYIAMTPPENSGPRYQLINGELVQMAGASLRHQIFLGGIYLQMARQVEYLQIGLVLFAPYDVHIDLFNTYQPDLLFVSNARQSILESRGITGAPDLVMEILSESTRRRDFNEKLPVYAANGVREVWIVNLEDATISVYSTGEHGATLVGEFTANDMLTSEVMAGVAIELGPIFARAANA
ncbi:MAG: Uma2 family endonuclease [Chloroflexota bacterium]|nr:Uma2 family endonuclease [Chloroflexota bacterium]